MHRSLNFLIKLRTPPSDSQPGGLTFIEEFKSRISSVGLITKEIEIWRDVGWEFSFSADGEEYSVVVSCLTDENKLLLQLSPTRTPNAMLRLFGFQPSATEAGLNCRRLETEELLATAPCVIDVQFAYDRCPVYF